VKLETRVGLFILISIGVFLYLSINIRAIRFDKDQYHPYKAFFEDTGGMALKAPVKIAGVEVGWVDEIQLHEDGKAEVMMQIDRNIKLAKNAYAMIHQDGLIGVKNLEIDPGDPTTGFLLPGSFLSMPGRTPASVGELLDQFRDIATTIQDISTSFKTVFASRQGEENMRKTLDSVTKASDRIADFSEVLQRTIHKNEENINTILLDVKQSVHDLKEAIPNVTNNLQKNADKFGEASGEAKRTFKSATEVVDKVNTGKGTIGRLINEDEPYNDLRKTIRGVKNYVSKTGNLMLDVDMHSETMLRHTNSKGYFNLRLRPNSDYFYLISLTADEQGSVKREQTFYTRRDDKGNILRASDLNVPLERKIEFADDVEKTTILKDDILFGLQFGKRFDRLAFRIGLFESAFGFACDYYVPLPTDKFHWITSLEAFDFRGRKRLNDSRPHLKWLNKLFFMKNFYTSFGIDDFYSKNNANPFFGGGLRFGDDDLKYFLSQLSGAKGAGGK